MSNKRSTFKRGGPALGPMLNRLYRGPKGGPWSPPDPHLYMFTPQDTAMQFPANLASIYGTVSRNYDKGKAA